MRPPSRQEVLCSRAEEAVETRGSIPETGLCLAGLCLAGLCLAGLCLAGLCLVGLCLVCLPHRVHRVHFGHDGVSSSLPARSQPKVVGEPSGVEKDP